MIVIVIVMGERLESLSSMIQDVEEGEISDDTASVEEITEEDFVKPPETAKVLVVSNQNQDSEDPKPRVWTMRDLYKYQNKYQTPSNYASGLYHLAWSQAVQNKPLDEILEFNNTTSTTTTENSTFKRSGSSMSMNDDNYNNNNKKKKSDCGASAAKEVSGKVVIDVSGDEADDDKTEVEDIKKEEGELEEGEIDLDSEPDVREAEEEVGSKNNDLDHAPNISNVNVKENALEKRVKLIRDGLEAVIVNDEGK